MGTDGGLDDEEEAPGSETREEGEEQEEPEEDDGDGAEEEEDGDGDEDEEDEDEDYDDEEEDEAPSDAEPPPVRSEDSLLAERLMREELEEAGLGGLLNGNDDLAASLALAMELQRAEEAEQLEDEGEEGPDVDNMTYEELLALGDASESA
jgi:hypothetical protein